MKKMSSTEAYCWNYIQDNLTKIPKLTISEIAENAHVSISTVNRALKKQGFDGYIDFRQYIRNKKDEPRKNGFSKEVNEAIRKNEVEITRTINQLSVEDIERAIELIDHHKDILIFSAGLSTNVARETVSKLQLFGKYCLSYDDPEYMKYYAQKASEKSIVLAISISGETPEIISAVKIARARNVRIIAITAARQSSLSDLSDVCLSAYKSKLKELNFGLDVGSRIPLQVVNRILIDAYAIYKDFRPLREEQP